MKVLSESEWQAERAAHQAFVQPILSQVRQRKARGVEHPIEDFLWTYYSFKPTQFERWHPGAGIGLHDALEHKSYKGYTTQGDVTTVSRDFLVRRSESLHWMWNLQHAMQTREPKFGCFGLHEWAMVYRLEQSDVRHEQAPLRLPPSEIAEVVEAQELKCTHFDAFRFYVPQVRSLNHLMLTRETQLNNEQSGCLHANMDLYKWAYKLSPIVSTDLLTETFVLAREIRMLDMQATPYDLSEWDVPPVRVETPEGKSEYVTRQREFSARAQTLRMQLLEQIEQALHLIDEEPVAAL